MPAAGDWVGGSGVAHHVRKEYYVHTESKEEHGVKGYGVGGTADLL